VDYSTDRPIVDLDLSAVAIGNVAAKQAALGFGVPVPQRIPMSCRSSQLKSQRNRYGQHTIQIKVVR
jgi:hypothetical protein